MSEGEAFGTAIMARLHLSTSLKPLKITWPSRFTVKASTKTCKGKEVQQTMLASLERAEEFMPSLGRGS